jgi:hypothetical protein
MQSTTVNELLSKGFTEDPLAVKALQKSFALPLVVGTVAFVLAFALMMLERVSSGVGISIAAVSWCFIVLTLVCMYRARPKSRHTGKPLLKYKNRSPDSGVILELIYVCPDSKTFSRRVYLENGDG